MARFVVFEGLDGAGTTTQAARLVDAWRAEGAEVFATREPTDGPIGRRIRETLRAAEGSAPRAVLPWLFAADRAEHVLGRLEPLLAGGTHVVSDRYLPSSLAYQSLDHPLDLVDGLNRWFRVPDVLVQIDVSVDTALQRIGGRGAERDIFEARDQLEAIRAQYEVVYDLLAERDWPIVRIDGEAPVDEVTAAVFAAVGDP